MVIDSQFESGGWMGGARAGASQADMDMCGNGRAVWNPRLACELARALVCTPT